MAEIEDWLQDPLMEISKGSYQYRKLKNLDEKQYELWQIFHYATGLKLRGANFFRTKVIDTARTSEDTKLRWYLDAFFFELMSAYDTLLQELNIVYAYDLGLKPEKVRWNDKNLNNFMKKLPNNILENIATEREKDWFCEVQWYRNTTTHHYRIPISRAKIWSGRDSTYYAGLQYIDREDKIKIEEISVCKEYLSDMVNYISSVWGKMAQKFE